jgi:hypothetical protein
MMAILQFAIQLYSLDQDFKNDEWAQVSAEVLEKLVLREEFLPELVDVILDRYHGQARKGAPKTRSILQLNAGVERPLVTTPNVIFFRPQGESVSCQ